MGWAYNNWKRRKAAHNLSDFALLIATPTDLGTDDPGTDFTMTWPAAARIGISVSTDLDADTLVVEGITVPERLADVRWLGPYIESGEVVTISPSAAMDLTVYVIDEWGRYHQIAIASTNNGFTDTFDYAHTYGQGDRSATVTVSGTFASGDPQTLVNGLGTDLSAKFTNGSSGNSIEFEFPTVIQIDQFTWDQGSNSNHNTWKCQAKLNSGDTYVDVSNNFVFTGTAGTIDMTSTPNLKFFKLTQVSGTASGTPFLQEFTFRTRDN